MGGACGWVERGGALLATLRHHEVSELQLHPSTEITPGARRVLLGEGIDVAFIDGRGRLRGRLVAAGSRAGGRRLAWCALVLDEARRLAVARAVVAGKIENQRGMLRQRQRRASEVGPALERLGVFAEQAGAASSLEHLRGIEGIAAKRYYGGMSAALRHPDFEMKGRTRRPPRDGVNACLSYGYALLVAACEGAAQRAGLDPYIGCLHEASRGAPALALDLAEELRPAVDGVVLSLFNRRQLHTVDFRRPPAEELDNPGDAETAVYLGATGRDILIRAWERRLSSTVVHPLRGDRWPLRGLIVEQAHQLARVAEGAQDVYRPIRLWG